MKHAYILLFFIGITSCFAQDDDWVKAEGVITEIQTHLGKRTRESATIKFNLVDGTEQIGVVELFRIPFLGSFKSEGDTVTINYRKSNPVLVETVMGNFMSKYGMYILVFLGIILSIKPFLKLKNKE